ncbi:hypothetical protein [Nocardia sp. NPDC004711]
MSDRDLITEAQIQHSLQNPRCHGVMESPAPVRSFAACAVYGFEDYTKWPVAQDHTAELEHARDPAAHHALATLFAAFGVTFPKEVVGVLEEVDQAIAVALAAMRADPAAMEGARKRLRALGVSE